MLNNSSISTQRVLYSPRRPQVRALTVGEFYAYQGIALGGGSVWAIAAGSCIPLLTAPLVVGILLFASQQWQRRSELARYDREYYDYSRQLQALQLQAREGAPQ